jgi:hypothetical protein
MILHEEKNPKHDAIDFVMHRFIHMVQQTHYHLSQWGSGSLAEMSVFESKYKEGLTVSAIAIEVMKNVFSLYFLFFVKVLMLLFLLIY